jgi:phosphohistidine phosphatase
MRHGIAAELGEGGVIRDDDRPLTEDGRAKLQEAAVGMRGLKLKFNLIFTSPLLRARQTAEVVADVLDLQHKIKVIDALAPGRGMIGAEAGQADIFIEMGAHSFDRALLVGHQPDLSEMASLLLTGNRNLNIEFKKGTVCAIQVTNIPPRGPGLLLWQLTPKHLRSIGKS